MILRNKFDEEEIIKNISDIDNMNVIALKEMLCDERDKFACSDYVGDKMVGFMFVTRETFDGNDSAFIQVCFSKRKGAVHQMLEELYKWMEERQIKKIYFMTNRNPIPFSIKYGFTPIYTVMYKEIE